MTLASIYVADLATVSLQDLSVHCSFFFSQEIGSFVFLHLCVTGRKDGICWNFSLLSSAQGIKMMTSSYVITEPV